MDKYDVTQPPGHRFRRCTPFRSRAESKPYRMCNDYASFLVITAGRMWWQRDGDEPRQATVGDVVYHPPDRLYSEWTDPRAPVRGVKLNFDWLAEPWPWPDRVHDHNGLIRRAAERLLLIWGPQTQRQHSPRYSLHMIFAGVLGEYLELSLEQLPELQERVRGHVLAHIERQVPVPELAALFGYSPAYFVRKFTATVGHSPSEDVRRVRLSCARELVLSTDLPVKTVAARTGFSDGPHLSRLFRRYFHCSIRELRTQIGPPAEAAEPHAADAP